MKKKRSTISILLIFAVLMGISATGYAQVNRNPLAAVSPTNNQFGTPLWYQGQNGQQLQLCLDLPIYDILLDPTCAPIQDPCLLDIGMVPNQAGTACIPDPILNPGPLDFDPRQPLSLPGNFPPESFYYMGDAIIDNVGPNGNLRMLLLVHLEVAFLGAINPGAHIIFSRIQVDSGTTAGPSTLKLTPNSTYTFTFPMGQIVGTTDATGVLLNEGGAATGRIRHEIGCAGPPCNPALAITPDPFFPEFNIIGPNFLSAVGFPQPIAPYTGLFLGNPNLGDQLIQPGANGNFFRVAGPNVGGPGVNTIQTLAFSIMGKQFAPPILKKWLVDFDGDIKTDMTIYRDGVWFVRPSSGAPVFGTGWGLPGDIQVPGDYDGDNKTDMAVYRPSNGSWFIMPSGTPAAPLVIGWGGGVTDKAVPGDYDGDGKTDAAIYRNGIWFVRPSSGAAPFGTGWGLPGDLPVPGDYDADGRTDIAIYRPTTGSWFVMPSATPTLPLAIGWGGGLTDKAVPGDYDGDQKADAAIYRDGIWFVRPSSGAAAFGTGWGIAGDVPTPGDYDGDAKTDIAVFRPSSGIWFVIPSATPGAPFGIFWGGIVTDVPVTTLIP